jgi:hypothetical protein
MPDIPRQICKRCWLVLGLGTKGLTAVSWTQVTPALVPAFLLE